MSENHTSFPVDINQFLSPISEGTPVGEWLRYEGTYDKIELARKEDDPTLSQGIWKTQLKKANWPEVAKYCQDALRVQSKDLQIAAWLIDAWVQIYGFQALQPGFDLLSGLCANFWEGIYPAIEDDDPSYRLVPFEWLDRRLSLQIKRLPITAPSSGDVRSYSYSDWELALHRERSRQSDDDKDISEARIITSGTLSSPNFIETLIHYLSSALDSLVALNDKMSTQFNQEFSSLHTVRDSISNIKVLVSQFNGNSEVSAVNQITQSNSDLELIQSEPDLHTETSGAKRLHRPSSRADAYRMLQEAADYLQRTEPHSPTSYLVKRAVAWGSKSLPELLAEIVNTPQDLKAIYQLLAVRPPEGIDD